MKIKTQTQDTKIYRIQQEQCLEIATVWWVQNFNWGRWNSGDGCRTKWI